MFVVMLTGATEGNVIRVNGLMLARGSRRSRTPVSTGRPARWWASRAHVTARVAWFTDVQAAESAALAGHAGGGETGSGGDD